MYNLLVSANENDWEGKTFSIEVQRCINENEYTDGNLVRKFGKLNSPAIKKLKKFPCIFAYEESCQKNPKFGYIKQVVKGKICLEISYQIVKLKKFLTYSQILKLKFKLGIPSWEMNRTHWALKEIVLEEVLQKEGIKLPDSNIVSSSAKNSTGRERKNRGQRSIALKIKNSQFHFGPGDNVKDGKSVKKSKEKHSWKDPAVIVVIIAAIIGAPWWTQIFQKSVNAPSYNPDKIISTPIVSFSPSPLPTQTPTATDSATRGVISIDEGKSYTDEESGITIGVNYVLLRSYSHLTITFPRKSSEEFKDVKSGKRFDYRGKNGSDYILTIVEIMSYSVGVRIDPN